MRGYTFDCVTIGYLRPCGGPSPAASESSPPEEEGAKGKQKSTAPEDEEEELLCIPSHLCGHSVMLSCVMKEHAGSIKLKIIDAPGQSADMLALCFELLHATGDRERDSLLVGAFEAERWRADSLGALWGAVLFLESRVLRSIVLERVVYLRAGDRYLLGIPRIVAERYPLLFLLHVQEKVTNEDEARFVLVLPRETKTGPLSKVVSFMARTHKRPFTHGATLMGSWINDLSNMAQSNHELAISIAYHANEVGVHELVNFLMDNLQKCLPVAA